MSSSFGPEGSSSPHPRLPFVLLLFFQRTREEEKPKKRTGDISKISVCVAGCGGNPFLLFLPNFPPPPSFSPVLPPSRRGKPPSWLKLWFFLWPQNPTSLNQPQPVTPNHESRCERPCPEEVRGGHRAHRHCESPLPPSVLPYSSSSRSPLIWELGVRWPKSESIYLFLYPIKVLSLKEKLSSEFSLGAVTSQKIIFKGISFMILSWLLGCLWHLELELTFPFRS